MASPQTPTFAQLAYLAAVPPEGITVTGLSIVIGRRIAATSRMVKRMRRAGLVEVLIPEEDGREHRVFRAGRPVAE